MNCQEFENGLDALARGSLADARTRAEASAHAEECARCAARLADERALTEGLRALRSRLQAAEAPPRVESALLAAMRASSSSVETGAGLARAEGAGGARVVGTSGAPVEGADDARVADLRRWSWTKTVAVAALAAAAAVAFFMLIPPGMSVPPGRSASEVAGSSGSQGSDAAPASQSGQQDVQTVSVDDAPVPAMMPPSVKRDWNNSQRVALNSRASVHPRATEAKFETGARAATQPQPGDMDAGEAEVVTDFIPLMQGARLAQGDGGRLVRVELPRSALASFGLPVNAEAGGRVKADVLLGEDGLARAIRFVR
jgi:hypothetical protein